MRPLKCIFGLHDFSVTWSEFRPEEHKPVKVGNNTRFTGHCILEVCHNCGWERSTQHGYEHVSEPWASRVKGMKWNKSWGEWVEASPQTSPRTDCGKENAS